MMFNCIDRTLSNWFKHLGHFIGDNPGYFVIVPLLIALIFATGIQRLHYEDDPEYLFSPTNGRSKYERQAFDQMFHMNYSQNFDSSRITHKGRFGRVIVATKNEANVLSKAIFDEIVFLDKAIRSLKIEYDDVEYRYADLCAKTERGTCWENDILDFAPRIEEIESRKYFLHYPIWINQDVYKAYFFPAFLGGVRNDSNGLIESARAVNLMYFLDVTVKRGDEKAAIWEQKFLQLLANMQFKHISIARFVSTTLRTELESNTQSLVPFFCVTVIVMLVFSVGTCMMSDWVRSKPWLGLLACISAELGVVASFGLCMYCGIDMISINLAAPFLMLGVGMDDAFVLLAAWRRTNPSHSVSVRLGHTYSEAAISITITSVTNFISFMIGILTPFPSVRIFCIYTSIAVLFTYIYHITFFGGCMAFFGYIEKRKLHALVFVPVMPKSLAVNKGSCFQLFCTGGRNEADPDNPIDNKDHAVMIFFRDNLANSLNKRSIKVVVLAIFLVYLIIGIYGCTIVKEGLDRRKLSRDDSYSVKYYDYDDRFFREYPYRIQVMVNKTLNYADPDVQDQIEAMLLKFESSEYVESSILTESWLRAYKSFLQQEQSFIFVQALNITDKQDFIRGFRDIFLHFPLTETFRNDVVFNENGTEIIATRYVIQTKNIKDANMEKDMLIALRRIADSFHEYNVQIFHQLFIFFDQFILVRDISLQTISIAAFVMMFISLLFIPSPICAFWVAFSIISIEIGVIGYMTLWAVNLDSISMINLIMCIGFSVDFSAHICYAYISCEASTPSERVRHALYSLGLPILQGSVSTILGIIALAFTPSYLFLTFFKTVFLVMLFGATHGVLLLPVLLSITDNCRSDREKSDKSLYRNNVSLTPHPFDRSEKTFDGKRITQNGNPIYIPRPTYIEALVSSTEAKYNETTSPVDEDSGQGSKSSASSEDSVINEKDLGLGTSGEECSEGSWKASKEKAAIIQSENQLQHFPMPRNLSVPNLNRKNQSKWLPSTSHEDSHVNYGYISDSGDNYTVEHSSHPLASRKAEANSSQAICAAGSSAKTNRLSAYHYESPLPFGSGRHHQLEFQKITAPNAAKESLYYRQSDQRQHNKHQKTPEQFFQEIEKRRMEIKRRLQQQQNEQKPKYQHNYQEREKRRPNESENNFLTNNRQIKKNFHQFGDKTSE
ncbi:patched domain-containing protein 3-like protein [Dinothrombium tinctorium]|uniref:Patched domain-containing protein 3-like protein n=1 Tax=Dinothrombium tinctorium TaxID=1965070 RepID=A0A3S4R506_9ACAR|nr:patched domain-containing protein 3-like protein [Dinothrombium tinctorium]RWS11674.1 patched domain-containing protein 3-like protein [Dinothrombium tinctorium]RWS11862.1 patched domain-containing protein 3-like protein [Dinothrombium tinctorium]RWS11869.1 patched domain-containing protein 3-like protein [Dinothrombium tinctorium]